MTHETTPAADARHGIFILAVVTPRRSAEIKRVLSHTRWQTHVVSSIHEAVQALRCLPVSVVLCEDRLSDGKWLDFMRESEQLCKCPETIVLSECAGSTLWGEVLDCGGYGVLALPLDPREVYEVIPMAWRRFVGTTERSLTRAIERILCSA